MRIIRTRNPLFLSLLFSFLLLISGCGEGSNSEQAESGKIDQDNQGVANQTGPEPGSSADLLARGDQTFRTRDYRGARVLYQQAITAASEENDMSNLAEALAQVARTFSICDSNDAGRPYLTRAGSVAAKDQPGGWSRYQLVLGVYEREDGRREQATERFADLYDFCLDHKLYSRAINAAHMAAIAAATEAQILWAEKGIEAAEKGGFDSWLAVLWNNLGWTYSDLGRHAESLEALRQARKYHWQTGDDLNKLIADWSVGFSLRMNGIADSARVWSGKTLTWAKERYEADPSPDNAEWVGHSLREMSELSLETGKVKEAIAYLQGAYGKLGEAGMANWAAEDFQSIRAKLDSLKAEID